MIEAEGKNLTRAQCKQAAPARNGRVWNIHQRENLLLSGFVTTPLQTLAPNLWLLSYPLKMLGVDLHRNVTVIRLASGKLIIHSTAPFTAEDVAAIEGLGEPGWLVETLLRHDTFAREGRAAFPNVPYLAPEGFSTDLEFSTGSLIPEPEEWKGEVAVLAIDGAPEFGEIVMLHRPSRTLIVADLIFHFSHPEGFWKKTLLTLATVGGEYEPGVTKPFKQAIKNHDAFEASVRTLLEWDFDRVVVGHGEPIPTGGKEKLREALHALGI